MEIIKQTFVDDGKHFPPAPKAVLLAEAVLRYDAAIESCGNDPEKMASFCTAEGDHLDKLYFEMVNAARALLGYGSDAAQERSHETKSQETK
jgi:hypothetical protein